MEIRFATTDQIAAAATAAAVGTSALRIVGVGNGERAVRLRLHGNHDRFFRALYDLAPDAEVRTARAHYCGAEHYRRARLAREA